MTRFLTLAVVLAAAPALTGGLYDPAKPELPLADAPPLGLPHPLFVDQLDDVIAVGLPTPVKRARKEALAARDALRGKATLTPGERLWLGVLNLRLRETDSAFTDLQQAYAADPRSFFALAALGTAYQQTGQVAEAVRYLETARDLFPPTWPGNAAEARTLEAAQLKLARLRQRESAGRPGRLRPPEDVDDLFGVRYVGPSGQYEAGAIDPAEKAKLPADATRTVQRLMIWLPDDTRLYWLLGELYNAAGDLDAASAVFNECVDSRRLDSPRLREHRQAVKAAIAARPAPPPPPPLIDMTRVLIAAAVVAPILLVLVYFQVRELFRRTRTPDRGTG
jgi:tetratricopeptide (TPR) repeat protein